jgi:endo-1,4-beta-D-glucanase Y
LLLDPVLLVEDPTAFISKQIPMAYVPDFENHDARTEGLSYGMMIAFQLNRNDVFNRIWRWSKKYLQHPYGPREGYFAWSMNPGTLKYNSGNFIEIVPLP